MVITQKKILRESWQGAVTFFGWFLMEGGGDFDGAISLKNGFDYRLWWCFLFFLSLVLSVLLDLVFY